MKSTRVMWVTVFIAVASSVTALHAGDRPNILWLTAEDMSPHLGCYGEAEAATPRLDALAREAVRFDCAFATAPVCSPARSCLITGMYATSLGTQRLRYPLGRLLEAADCVGRDDASRQRALLRDVDDGVRYGAAVALQARSRLSDADCESLQVALNDTSPVVRIEAAAALARNGDAERALPVLTAALQDESQEISLHAARALELLGPLARPAKRIMSDVLTAAREAEGRGNVLAMFIRFSLESALQNL